MTRALASWLLMLSLVIQAQSAMAQAPAAEDVERPILAVFDIIYKHYKFPRQKMYKEVEEHYLKGIEKATPFQVMHGEDLKRLLRDKRVFSLSEPDREGAERTCRKADIPYHITARIWGLKNRRVEVTVILDDAKKENEGINKEVKLVRNHFKVIRDTVRKLAAKAATMPDAGKPAAEPAKK